jgi:hypothetical protein
MAQAKLWGEREREVRSAAAKDVRDSSDARDESVGSMSLPGRGA